jgi:hypothetical protein
MGYSTTFDAASCFWKTHCRGQHDRAAIDGAVEELRGVANATENVVSYKVAF